MKSLKLCAIAFVAGVGIAAVTQYPVLETLGYLPDDAVETSESESMVASSSASTSPKSADSPSVSASSKSVDSIAKGSTARDSPSMGSTSKGSTSAMAPVAETEGTSDSKANVNTKKLAATQPDRSIAESNPGAVSPSEPRLRRKATVNTEAKSNAALKEPARPKVAATPKAAADKPVKSTKPSEVASAEGSSSRQVAPRKVRNLFAPQGSKDTKAKDLASKDEAGNRVPVIRTPAASDKPKRIVVAKPPLKEVSPKDVANPELIGTWYVTRALHAGKKIPFDKLKSMSMEFDGQQITIVQGGKRELANFESGDIKKIGETTFAELKITSTIGAQEIRGFYYLDSNELTMIWGAPGADRPDPTNSDQMAKARILTLQSDK